jgi:hydrogenase-4 component D
VDVSTIVLFAFLLFLPIVGAFVAIALDRGTKWFSTALAAVVLTLGLDLLVRTFPKAMEVKWAGLPWLPVGGVFGFRIDPLSALMLLVITLIGFLVILFSNDYIGPGNVEHPVRDGQARYYFWMLLFLGSMIGVALSPNFLQLFIFWELTTLCSWALISYYEEEKGLRAGYKALLMTHIGGLFLMTGIVVLFVKTGSFDFDALSKLSPGALSAFFALTLVGGWAKAAQGPFYTWLPDAMEAPTPVSAYLHAAAMVKAGVYLVARVVLSCTPQARGELVSSGMAALTAVIALITMFMALFLFFFQDDLKRLLALSTITHLAYIIAGSALGLWGSWPGFQGGILHIAAHGAGKALLFLSVGALAYFSGSKRISELSGVGSKLPLVAVGFFVGAFTVTGVPPFAGFFSKLLIIGGALAMGGVGAFIGALLLLESVIAFAWFLWVGQKVFFGSLSPAAEAIGSSSAPIRIALLALIILCIGITAIALPIVLRI